MLSPYESSQYWNAIIENNIQKAKAYFEGVSTSNIEKFEHIGTKRDNNLFLSIDYKHSFDYNDPQHRRYRLWAARRILKERKSGLEKKI